MTNEELYLWRKGLQWSRKQAAAKLGISVASLQIYERGTRFESDDPVAVPQVVALACKHLTSLETV
jgi:transcriptional regulator with XRE-family HTH domain